MNSLNRIEELIKICSTQTAKSLSIIKAHLGLLYKYAKDEASSYGNVVLYNGRTRMQFDIVIDLTKPLLKEHFAIIKEEARTATSTTRSVYIPTRSLESVLEHALDLIEISLIGEEDVAEGNIFLGIDEKLKRAENSARENNVEGLFSNLHTIVELLFKDKLGIALDMDGARLGKVLKICVEEDVFPGHKNILSQLNGNVCDIDNKIKHTGYNPTAKQMNDALLVTTQAVRVLKKEIPELKEDTIEHISALLIKNN